MSVADDSSNVDSFNEEKVMSVADDSSNVDSFNEENANNKKSKVDSENGKHEKADAENDTVSKTCCAKELECVPNDEDNPVHQSVIPAADLEAPTSMETVDDAKYSESVVFPGFDSDSKCRVFLRGCVILCQTSEKTLKNHPTDLKSAESLVELLKKLRNKTNDVRKKLVSKKHPEAAKIQELHEMAFSLWKESRDEIEIQNNAELILLELKKHIV